MLLIDILDYIDILSDTSCDNLLLGYYMPPTHIKTEINNKFRILDKPHWAKNKHKTFILGSRTV